MLLILLLLLLLLHLCPRPHFQSSLIGLPRLPFSLKGNLRGTTPNTHHLSDLQEGRCGNRQREGDRK